MPVPAVSNIGQAIAGGFDRAEFYVLSSDGYSQGQATTLTPGATGSGPYRLTGAKTAGIVIPKPTIDYATGDDIVQGSLLFSAATLPNFELGISVFDRTFQSLVQQIASFLQGNKLFAALQPDAFNLIDMALVLSRRAKAKSGQSTTPSTLNNVSMWEGVVIPKVNVYPLGSKDITERKIAEDGYWILCNPSSIMPDGSVVATGFAPAVDVPIFPFTSPNRFAYYSWIGDGTTTIFDLPTTYPGFKLIDNSLDTGSNGGRTSVYVEGVQQTTGLTIAVGSNPQTFTFTVAPASGHRIEATCEHF